VGQLLGQAAKGQGTTAAGPWRRGSEPLQRAPELQVFAAEGLQRAELLIQLPPLLAQGGLPLAEAGRHGPIPQLPAHPKSDGGQASHEGRHSQRP
jgi:hypothetical protein